MADASAESIKQHRAQLRETKAQAAADRINSKTLLAKWKKEQNHSRKSAGDLIQILDIGDIRAFQIRDTREYQAKSGSIDRQIRCLLDHLFVQYPVPPFLYDTCIRRRTTRRGENAGYYRLPGGICKRNDPFPENRELYRKWFIAVAQGASFPKLVKEIMTSREAAMFLAAPDNMLAHEGVWWAKMRLAGIPHETVRILMMQFFRDRSFVDKEGRLAEIIRFFGRFHREIDPRSINNVLACIAWKLDHEPGFRMHSRTAASMVNLSNEWRLDIQRAKLEREISWPGLGLRDWRIENWDSIWSVNELRNNRELYWESRKQKNCVYSYVETCAAGSSSIFSLRKFVKEPGCCPENGSLVLDLNALTEQSRATIEVERTNIVVQAKSKANAEVDADQYAAIKQWAAERALAIEV